MIWGIEECGDGSTTTGQGARASAQRRRSDKPLHSEIKLPGAADAFYQRAVAEHRPEPAAWMQPYLEGQSTSSLQLVAYDAFDEMSEASWVEAAFAQFGRIDAVIANAGIAIMKDVLTISDDELQQMLEVNVKAPRRLGVAAWEHLKQSGCGRIIIIASLSGQRVKSASSAAYSMSKYAAVALAHGFRRAGFEEGIRATAVCPGFVNSDMARAVSNYPPQDMTQPEDLARIIALLVDLPNEASVAEFAVNCQAEEFF